MKPFLYVKILRPVQWLKNLMLLFPPFLGGGIAAPGVFGKALGPVAAFCCASSATYILNDILDRKNDACHPLKKSRPIPSGRVSLAAAGLLSGLLIVLALGLGSRISEAFLIALVAYCLVSLAYSAKLKELPVVDLFCISACFLLRLIAGGEAFGVVISEWLFLCVFLLSLFLSTGKRLGEKQLLGERAGGHRKSLGEYPQGFLEGSMYMTGGAVLVTYTMYVISRHIQIYTVPLCTFGLLRYILRVKSGAGGDPTESLLKDLPLLVVGLAWALLLGWGIYFR